MYPSVQSFTFVFQSKLKKLLISLAYSLPKPVWPSLSSSAWRLVCIFVPQNSSKKHTHDYIQIPGLILKLLSLLLAKYFLIVSDFLAFTVSTDRLHQLPVPKDHRETPLGKSTALFSSTTGGSGRRRFSSPSPLIFRPRTCSSPQSETREGLKGEWSAISPKADLWLYWRVFTIKENTSGHHSNYIF